MKNTQIYLRLTTGGRCIALLAVACSALFVSDVSAQLRTEDLRVPVRGAVLQATLVLPAQEGPYAAAVLLPGSRDSRNLPRIAEYLAQRGVAVLDLRKRGVGGSTGTWQRETFQQRADDALAAVRMLRARADIDSTRVGLIGHSQGGYIAPLAAMQSTQVSYIVLLAGPGQNVVDQTLTYERIQRERAGLSPEEVDKRVRALRRQLSTAVKLRPLCRALRLNYICYMIDYDPVPTLERVTVPVLALFGEDDPMVPPEPNVQLVRSALERAANSDVTVRVFPHATHEFVDSRLPHVHDRTTRVYVPGFLDAMHEWIAVRVQLGNDSGTRHIADDAVDSSETEGHIHTAAASHAHSAGLRRHLLLPRPVLFSTAETEWAAGGELMHSYRPGESAPTRHPTITHASLILTQKRQVLASVSSQIYTAGNRERLDGALMYSHYPATFHGIGRDLDTHDGEPYTSRSLHVSANVRRRSSSGLFAGGGLSFNRYSLMDVTADGSLSGPAVPGTSGGIAVSLLLNAGTDTRDVLQATTRGSYVDTRVAYAAPVLGSDFEFARLTFDARHYAPLSARGVLAIQAFGTTAAGDVPFQMLSRLGGASLLRGLDPMRSLDRDVVALQAEYRADLWWRFGAAAFAGAGSIGRGVDDVWSGVRPSYGAGLRFTLNARERINLRVDVARGPDGSKLYVSAGEAF